MTTRNSQISSLGIALLLMFGAAKAMAVPTIYTDRTAFQAALSAFATEDFESFPADTPFHTVPVDVGAFTISMTGSPSTAYNFIDFAPLIRRKPT